VNAQGAFSPIHIIDVDQPTVASLIATLFERA
jgi:hypothetical protein